jgi:hypothetical protein
MAGDEPEIRPETHALDALIRRTIGQVRRTAHDPGTDAMLFLGSWHQAFPALLVQDPVLEPVDKVVWMVICQQGQAAGVSTAFPSYSEIARKANIASTSTVSRAIAVLRATRWLSLCARVRDAGGRFRGNVYALHDEPLPLADALHLDPEYMGFLSEARRHYHARVRRVAGAVLQSIDEDIGAGVDVLAPVSPMERRIEAVRAVRREGPRRYFSFSAQVLARLANRSEEDSGLDQDQNSKAGEHRLRILSPQKSKSVNGSSSNNKKITTTTTQDPQKSKGPSASPPLIYPARLSANQRGVADRYLATVSADQRQALLDELEGRLRCERQGAQPVYDELRYLYRLCRELNAGQFQPNLGLKVAEERERRIEEARSRAGHRQSRDTLNRERLSRKDDPFKQVRKALQGQANIKSASGS